MHTRHGLCVWERGDRLCQSPPVLRLVQSHSHPLVGTQIKKKKNKEEPNSCFPHERHGRARICPDTGVVGRRVGVWHKIWAALGQLAVPRARAGVVSSCRSHSGSKQCENSYLKPGARLKWGLCFCSQAVLLLAEPVVVQPEAEGWGPVIFNYILDQCVFHVVLKVHEIIH